MSTAIAEPPMILECLGSLDPCCPYCHRGLDPVLDTPLGIVWACRNKEWHGWSKLFLGGEDIVRANRNVNWFIEAALDRLI